METRILIPSVLMVVQVKEENKFETNRRGNGESSDETEIADSHSYSDSSSASSSSDEELGQSDRRSRRVFKNRKKRRRKRRNGSSKDLRGSVRLCAKESIDKGIIFGPNEGEIRIHHLHGVPNLLPEDVRYLFGCFDRLTSDPLDDSTEIRLCNWVRFLRRSLPQRTKSQDNLRFRSPCSSEDEVEVNEAGESPNVIAKYVEGRPVFEVKEVIPQGKELIATFDIASLTCKHSKGLDGPLDLTKGSSPPPPRSPLKCSSVTPPPQETTKESHVALPKSPLHQVKLSSANNNKLFQPYSDDFLQQRRSGMRSFLQSTPTSQSQPQGTATNTIQSSTQPTPVLVRPILRTRGRERSLLPCEVCGKAFDRPSLLKRHMRTHTGEKPHVCDVCSKGFSTSSSLNTHRRIHSGEKPHVCPVCGKRFTASSNLYYHRMTHNKEKPHKCVLCGKSFPTPGDLKSHQYVHSGSWPFTCPVCHRGFSKQTNLRNHLLLHSGDKPHNCHICSKKFALACNLRAHLRTHEESDNLLLTSTSSKDDSSFSGEKSVTSDSKPPSSLQMPPLLPLPRPTHHSPGGPQGISNSLRSSPYPSHSYIHPFLQLSRGGAGVPCSAAGGPTHPVANPFLERLFQWNLDFAQSAVGNLSVMQQRLVESQMLAAQLMIHGSTSSSTASATQQHQQSLTPPLSSLHSPMMFGFGGGIVGFEELLARIRPLSNSAGLQGNAGSNGSASGSGGSIDLSKLMRQ